MMHINDLEKRVIIIEQRNTRVEVDKAWETSWTRKFFIALFTYLAIGLYMGAIGVDKPLFNAIIPTVGFLLSTLSMPFIKEFWTKNIHRS